MQIRAFFIVAVFVSLFYPMPSRSQPIADIRNGQLQGITDAAMHVQLFRGIPYAAPPVGDLRWRAPQPVQNWTGVRQAETFGARPMQLPIFGDMNFRSPGASEDCLYLNVWTPATFPINAGAEKRPVLVYFYGGGFVGGDSSEPRYDGAHMAARGIVVVTVNYRLGIFGFFSHPELTAESPHHASGNYGLLDQYAALLWVQQNIAAFGGDPRRITIGGESAGSFSVSALMASPLSRDLIAGAIGESGAAMGSTLQVVPRDQAEREGVAFAAAMKAASLAELRAIPADRLLKSPAAKLVKSKLSVDGYFLPKLPVDIFTAGEQAHVPLLAGTNSAENGPDAIFRKEMPTLENYHNALQRLYPHHADEVFQLYPATTEAELLAAAQDLASDRFISHSTWKWMDLATRTGGQPTYYYYFTHPRPTMRPEMGNAIAGLAGGIIRNPSTTPSSEPAAYAQHRGAVHSAEIEYALGNLDTNTVYAWTDDDHAVSELMQQYFASFIKSANPSGAASDGTPDLVHWPAFSTGQRLVLDVIPHPARVDQLRARYDGLDRIEKEP